MPDLAKVIKGIECSIGTRGVKDCMDCPYDAEEQCIGCDALLLRDALELLKEQEHYTSKYQYKIDHTDCIWYSGGENPCPSTCSQYRDGWNDAMDYIFKNGEGYKPYRRDMNGGEAE